jgi:hypothetical protein
MIAAIEHVLFVLTFRTLPFVFYACISPNVKGRARALTATVYLVLVLAVSTVGMGTRLATIALGSIYFVAWGSAVPLLCRALAVGRVTRGGLFIGLTALSVVAPALFAPDIERFTFLVVGWDLLMSAHSYCVDVSTSRASPRMGDCLFFLFVNPTLTYSNSGHRVAQPALDGRGIGRVALGLASIFVGTAFLRPACRAVANDVGLARAFSGLPIGALALGTLRFMAEYASHSGLASIQIGLMRQIGYRIPERYHYPFLAASPLDFWRRWNAYVSGWLGKYVLLPLTRRLHRFPSSGVKAVALIGTFLVSGLFHDGLAYLFKFAGSTRYIQLFGTSSLALILWLGCTRLVDRMANYHPRIHVLATPLTFVSRVGTLLTVVFAVARWSGR